MKRRLNFILILICIQAIITVVHFGLKKECNFLDENFLYMYIGGRADRVDHEDSNYFVSGQYYHDYMSITENKRFNFANTYNNVKYGNVHPPLYYYLVNFYNSLFFVNSNSPWSCISLNIILYVFIIIFFYKFVSNLLKNNVSAGVVTILFTCSIGIINVVLYMRMYILCMLFVVLNLYLHQELLKIIRSNSLKKEKYYLILIALCTFLGFMSHYYYLILSFFLSLLLCIYMLFTKKIKNMIHYCIAMFSGLIMGIIVHPNFFSNITAGPRGPEAFKYLFNSNFVERLNSILTDVRFDFFYDSWHNHFYIKVFLFIFVIMILYNLIRKLFNHEYHLFYFNHAKQLLTNIMIVFIIITFLCFFIIIIKIMAFSTIRYLYISYPLLIIIIYLFLNFLFSFITPSQNKINFLIIVMFILMVFVDINNYTHEIKLESHYKIEYFDYLYPQRKELNKKLVPFYSSGALIIYKDYYFLAEEFDFYGKYRLVNTTNEKSIYLPEKQQMLKEYGEKYDRLIVYYIGDVINGNFTEDDYHEYNQYLSKITNFDYELYYENVWDVTRIYAFSKKKHEMKILFN